MCINKFSFLWLLLIALAISMLLNACDPNNISPSHNDSEIIVDSLRFSYFLTNDKLEEMQVFDRSDIMHVFLKIENLSQSIKCIQTLYSENYVGDCYDIKSGNWIEWLSIVPPESDTVRNPYRYIQPISSMVNHCCYDLSYVPSGKYYYQAYIDRLFYNEEISKTDINLKEPIRINFKIR